jgi:hypothetical protein
MAKKEPLDPNEALAAALAAYLLSVSTLRLFVTKGIVAQDEADLIVTSVLSRLEKDDLVSESAAHGARALLSALGSQLGIQQKQPN